MPITITIDESPEGELELDLVARKQPDPAHLQIATMLFTELHNHLQAHKGGPGCNPGRKSDEPRQH